jgi:3-hydroxybutyryl-CoA dehydrogenase
MNIRNIAVIGAGVMGADVALDLACYDIRILLKDIDTAILDHAKKKIAEDHKMLRMLKPEMKQISLDDIYAKIDFVTNYQGFEDIDLVIENITENWEAKKALYTELGKVCEKNVLFAVNTSCISISRIASLLPCPGNVIGVHFMNPVPLKNMVETIRGSHTTRETEDTIVAFLKSIKKTPIVVNDFPGFVANRLSHLFMNEAAFLVQDNVAQPREIDAIFKQGYGHKMGPLETADLIGLDTVVNSLEILYESYQDPKYRCCPLLRKMVDSGFYGRKSGKGFYTY